MFNSKLFYDTKRTVQICARSLARKQIKDIHTHTHTRTHYLSLSLLYTQTHRHTLSLCLTYTNTHTHTHTHTLIHIHTHTYTVSLSLFLSCTQGKREIKPRDNNKSQCTTFLRILWCSFLLRMKICVFDRCCCL